MELLFIWIKNHKNLETIGLNFSNQFQLNYEEKTNTISVERRENFIPKFFGNNITNLTGLIGENGVGKTTILRYLLQFLVPGINQDDEKAVIVFKSENGTYYYSNQNTKLVSQSVEVSPFQWTDDLHELKNTLTCVFLSNHFDPSSFYSHEYSNMEFMGMVNLSSYFLLYSDIQSKFNIDMEQGNISFNSRMEAFAAGELKRIVRVIKWIRRQNVRNPFPVSPSPFLNLKLINHHDESISKKNQT